MSVMNAPVAGTLPLHIVGLKNILVETLHNVGHPTMCPKPLNSVRLMVPYIVQCLHNDFFKPTLCRGGSRPPVRMFAVTNNKWELETPATAAAVSYLSRSSMSEEDLVPTF